MKENTVRFFNLDEVEGPNPPPWQIHYVNDQKEDRKENPHWYDGCLPEAHTHGLDQFGDFDLQIRMAPPNVAASVLDKIGLWVLSSEETLKLGDMIKVLGTKYTLVKGFSVDGKLVCRLAWDKDPLSENDPDSSKPQGPNERK